MQKPIKVKMLIMKILSLLRTVYRFDSKVVSVKENFVLFLTVILTWFASFTILIPLVFFLKVSKKLRQSLQKWIMRYKKEGVNELSKKLFLILRDSCPQFDFRKFHFLELGERTPYTFDEYSEQHEIDIVCDDPEWCRKMADMRKKIHVCSESSVFEDCKENTYDVVISTFYLCSVKNPKIALNNIRRILKPGGKFAFLEHCGFPENEFCYKFQRLISPIWQIIFGCRLSHHPSHLLMYSSFHSLNYKTYYNPKRLVFFRPVIVGVCTK